MSPDLVQQFSDALAQAAEKLDAARAELAYTKDKLALTEAQVSVLSGQVKLHELAGNVRREGDRMNVQASKANVSLFGKSNSAEEKAPTQNSGSAAPENFEFN